MLGVITPWVKRALMQQTDCGVIPQLGGAARRWLASLGAALLYCAAAGAQVVSTPGQFGVNPSGAAAYSVPLRVPPGIAGMEPKLSLEYDSSGPNGMLGVGWRLSGLSAIVRCAPTLAQDSGRAWVRGDSQHDRYCLDGQRLKLVSGSFNGQPGSEYRTEIDVFSKVVAGPASGSGPLSFTVKTKSGLTMVYGGTADSRKLQPGTDNVIHWMLSSVVDVSDNVMTVTYGTAGQQPAEQAVAYPVRIDYGNRSVRFEYQPRTDKQVTYEAGLAARLEHRLAAVRTYVDESIVKQYLLSYSQQQPDMAIASKLVSLRECTWSHDVCLLPTQFDWTVGVTHGFSPFAGGQRLKVGSAGNLFVGDFDGDGRSDVTGYDEVRREWNVCLSQRQGDTEGFLCSYWGGHQGGFQNNFVADFTGDGRADLLAYHNDQVGWTVCPSTGSSFQCPTFWGGPKQGAGNIVIADFDGDGRADVAAPIRLEVVPPDQVQPTSSHWEVCLSTGAGFVCNSLSDFHNRGRANTLVGDFNGDGMQDMAVRTGNSDWKVCVSTGTDSIGFECSGWSGPPVDPPAATTGDFNGDGKVDLAYPHNGGWTVCPSTGRAATGFACKWWGGMGGDHANNVLMDVNGDGKSDLVVYTGANGVWNLCLATGDAFNCAQVFSHTAGADRNLTGDFNGDGLSDMIGDVGPEGWDIRKSAGVKPFITKFQPAYDGTGRSGVATMVTYAPLTDTTFYTKGNGPGYPVVDLQVPLYAAKRVETQDGRGGLNVLTYKYAGLKSEQAYNVPAGPSLYPGRGLLGFRTMTVDNESANIRTETTFRQDWPFIGMAEAQSVGRISGGGQFKQVLNEYVSEYGSSTESKFVYMSASTESSWDLGGQPLPRIKTETLYQPPSGELQYGNVSKVVVTNLENQSKKTTVNDYELANVANGNWILGRLKTATVTSSGSNDPNDNPYRWAASPGDTETAGAPPPPEQPQGQTPGEALMGKLLPILMMLLDE